MPLAPDGRRGQNARAARSEPETGLRWDKATDGMTDTRRRLLVLAITAWATFPVMLDATVLHLAVPALTRALEPSATGVLWIVDIYPLLMAGLVLSTGPLGDRIGHKRLLIMGLAVFGLASLAAGLSSSAPALIASRALLAVGGAMILPASLSLVRLSSDDPAYQTIAIGAWSSLASVSAAIGPLIGGVILEHLDWGYVFLINVPLALIGIGAALLAMRETPRRSDSVLDPVASVAIIIGIAALIYAVKAMTRPGLPAWIMIAAAAIGGLALALFTLRQMRTATPLIDPEIWRIKAVRMGAIVALVQMAVLVGFELLLAQHLQFAESLEPLPAAIAMLPMPVAAAIAGIGGGFAMARMHVRELATITLGTGALGYLMIAAQPGLESGAWFAAGLALAGFGHGVAITVASSVIMTEPPEHLSGAAASIDSVSYELGATLGVALLGSLMIAVFTAIVGSDPAIPAAMTGEARHAIGQALDYAATLPGARGDVVREAALEAQALAFQAVALASALAMALLAIYTRIPRRR